MRRRITAMHSLLQKTTRCYVENRNENSNKQALLQRSRAVHAWASQRVWNLTESI